MAPVAGLAEVLIDSLKDAAVPYKIVTIVLGLGIAGAGFGLLLVPAMAWTRIEAFYKPRKTFEAHESRASWSNIKMYLFKDKFKPCLRWFVVHFAELMISKWTDYILALTLAPILPDGRLDVYTGPTSTLLANAPGSFALSFIDSVAYNALLLPFKVATIRAALLPGKESIWNLFSQSERKHPKQLYTHLLPFVLQKSAITTTTSLISSACLALLSPHSFVGLSIKFAEMVISLTRLVVTTRLYAQYTGKDEQMKSVVPLRRQPYNGWLQCLKTMIEEEGWWFAKFTIIFSVPALGVMEWLARIQQSANVAQ
ncbi:hypothetical protein E3P99_03686 [Wallemia hederae]|uniref:Uncharacterized protein n=1 Tax=Wallemia hederae TaxID=1540922 RepID=A0A4T0FG98_9BASI|nr:hypothetical protein E3P99_03686 [Wallemia hederae]